MRVQWGLRTAVHVCMGHVLAHVCGACRGVCAEVWASVSDWGCSTWEICVCGVCMCRCGVSQGGAKMHVQVWKYRSFPAGGGLCRWVSIDAGCLCVCACTYTTQSKHT